MELLEAMIDNNPTHFILSAFSSRVFENPVLSAA